ncbi:MAG: hypothetical protein C5B59_00500 [Bacteroidetes bacterium]|nr:MAG: hypothetical protein C5B59_00500 [Bacteroidota bacterium]
MLDVNGADLLKGIMSIIEQIRQYEVHAEQLFPKLLDAVGVIIDRETGEIVKDKAGSLLLGFGIPDLLFRLECQQQRERKHGLEQDSAARAKIWRHIAEASKPMANPKSGEGSIADVAEGWQLNNWLPEGYPKFSRPPIQRSCEDCGLPWWSCDNHFAIVERPMDGSPRPQQEDSRRAWLCYWCIRHQSVLEKYKVSDSPKALKVRKKRAPNRSYLDRLQNALPSPISA